ncbi:MAG: HAD-IB family hydrolase [Betaproteobacteria bacterium]|jgi:HAD-superfamily subfamily IB hydrolase, TIGR01490|nr:HAD-IB family hydrolase [Betaproteobacteria bacterium]
MTTNSSLRLALFDLDHTLLSGDSDYEWGQFLTTLGVLEGDSHQAKNQSFYADYQAGTLDITAFLAFQLEPLSRFPSSQLNIWHQRFMEERILPLISDTAIQKIAEEKARSHLVAIVTATNRFVTGPIASMLGIDHLIATEPEIDEHGEFTGQVSGIPSFREGKIRRVDQWLDSLGYRWEDFSETAFYSDSKNDLPLLERASEPVAVNPDETLAQIAHSRHWPILHWMPRP